jgi:hypothetical protein
MDATRNPLREAWEHYAKTVMSADAGKVQRAETRQAFYAGAYVVVSACEAIGGPEVSEADGVALMARLAHECAAFRQEAMLKHILTTLDKGEGE